MSSMPRHLLWHEVARKLLGLPPAGPAPLPDYISAFNVWDRRIVLALRERIEAVDRAALAGRDRVPAARLRVHPLRGVRGRGARRVRAGHPRGLDALPQPLGPGADGRRNRPGLCRLAAAGRRRGDDLGAIGYRAGCAAESAVGRSLHRRAQELSVRQLTATSFDRAFEQMIREVRWQETPATTRATAAGTRRSCGGSRSRRPTRSSTSSTSGVVSSRTSR